MRATVCSTVQVRSKHGLCHTYRLCTLCNACKLRVKGSGGASSPLGEEVDRALTELGGGNGPALHEGNIKANALRKQTISTSCMSRFRVKVGHPTSTP